MKLLVTGANGFAGGWLIRRLLADGHEVTGAVGGTEFAPVLDQAERARVAWVPLDLTDPGLVAEVAAIPADAVVHLAAVSSVRESLAAPDRAWQVNALGTARLLHALGERRRADDADPVVLVVSSGEVYGRGDPRPRREDDPVRPVSPYAASKAAAELAALETGRRSGLRVVVARAFPHTGPGQSAGFVVPSFAHRMRLARRRGAPAIKTGNLEPVRDLLDVRDVAEAYLGLLTAGTPGEIYNVASGTGVALEDLFDRMTALLGVRLLPERDQALARAVEIPHLVGDPGRLRAATGWRPRRSLDETLRDVLDAQTD